jgi:hypothetical protein
LGSVETTLPALVVVVVVVVVIRKEGKTVTWTWC